MVSMIKYNYNCKNNETTQAAKPGISRVFLPCIFCSVAQSFIFLVFLQLFVGNVLLFLPNKFVHISVFSEAGFERLFVFGLQQISSVV